MVTKQEKLLLITSEFPPNVGGIGNHAYNLASSLSNEGYKVTVIADIIDVDEFERNAFASSQSFKVKWIPRNKLVVVSYLQRLLSSTRLGRKADKIICSGKFSLWQAVLLRRLNKSKEFIAVVHGSELDIKSSLPKKLTAYALSRFNKIIAVSNYTKNFLPTDLPGSIKQHVIHNGINLEEFVTDTSLRVLLQGDPALVTVGSVSERKGQENVIRALPEIQKHFPAAFYHIIGKPVLHQKLETIAKDLHVYQHIRFYGATDRKELLRLLSGATIKLMLSNHTSSGDFEGFGIAVLEANAFGIPVIGSRDSGIADAIQHLQTGVLVDPKNPNEVAEAVDRIISNYSTYSANAKEWARQHDWKNIVKEYISVLNN